MSNCNWSSKIMSKGERNNNNRNRNGDGDGNGDGNFKILLQPFP